MSRGVRLLVVCLLLLAFPLKGAFAVGMIACEPTQATGKRIAHAHHSAREHGAADVGHRQTHADHVHGPAKDAGSAPHDGEESAACNCDACCTGGSLVSAAAATVPAPPGGVFDFPDVIVRFVGHVPATPERPPRSFPI